MNIHILPTDKPSRFHTWVNNKGLKATLYEQPQLEVPNTAKNIYITSDEEIKVGDWFINFDLLGRLDTIYDPIHKCLKVNNNVITSFEIKVEDEFTILKSFCKKIILTTDQDLTKDGVQAIDDEFLEWFVKNPNCEEVEVEIDLHDSQLGNGYCFDRNIYKIIIPKKEPKQNLPGIDGETFKLVLNREWFSKQETLEEVVQKYSEREYLTPIPLAMCIDFARLGAKWQQERSHNDDEVIILLQKYRLDLSSNKTPNLGDTTKQWFEQFKKK